MKKIIPSIWIIKFSFKSIIKEKSFLIFNGIYLLFSLFIAIYSVIQKNSSDFLLIFDYYVLLSIFVILFILCLRLAQYFYLVKKEDKTLNIIITQQISRSKLFNLQFISFILLMLINITLSYLLINILHILFTLKINNFLIRVTSVYFLYALLSCVFLLSFFLLISLLTNIQVSTIIATLILSTTFISNMPYIFLIKGEEAKKISVDYNSSKTTLYVNEVYDSFDLKKQVLNKELKYSNLSLEIYNNFLENQYETDPNLLNNFESASNINKRINFWQEMGIVEKQSKEVNLTTPTRILAVNNNSTISKWKNDEITFKINLEYKFLTIEELQQKMHLGSLSDKQKKLLQEFIEFTQYITNYFTSFQSKFASLFESFIFLNDETNIEKNYIKNETKPEEENMLFDKKYLVEMYQNYFSFSDNKLRLENKKIEKLIEQDFYWPTMLSMRILEDYFIRYTNNMVILENSNVVKDEDWKLYNKSRTIFNSFFYFNFISNTLQSYTYFGGRSYEDFWFEPESSSRIFFNKQDNLFIAKPSYTFKLDDQNKIIPETYYNYLNPLFYILIQASIATINYFIAKNKFKKLDLKG
ncbi:ABC transporter permease [Spiroplasma cantharicola]|uniref:Uncharacterized protein n=1 Tax=Spiroplasma cantharicola TaxID=362837 RepID=A0A0M4KDV7_9MOLU|nr:ABC transporter permease [Spiroplasma cantharicola]ALD66032.1 hypothetical protein SCANT_v1c01220 [Spiroplasma cantharicola]